MSLGFLFFKRVSALDNDSLSKSFIGSTPGLITMILSVSTPQLIAKFLV